MRLILDTNVVISGVLYPASKPGLLLDLALSGSFASVTCNALVEEWRAVLKRPKLAFDAEAVDEVVDCLVAVSLVCVPVPQQRYLSPDPDDQFLMDLAVSANACIVTGNIRHFKGYPDVLAPAQAIEALRSTPSLSGR